MRGEGGRWPWPLLLFGVSLTASFVVIDLVVDGGAYLRHFHQSWTSHFAPAQSFEYGSAADHPFDWSVLLKNWDTAVPAVLGVVISVSRACKTRGAILPVAWLVLTLSVFGLHKPWWAYYYVHTALPLCWCAAIGLGALWERARARRSRGLFALLALYGLAALPWMVGRVYLQAADIRRSPQTYSTLVLQEIERLKPYTQWFYAAEPVYSFHAGIPMPPQLAVVPLKRLWSGDMTNARIAAEMGRIKPGLILLANDGREVPFEGLIQAEYRLIYQDARHRLYAHTTLAGK